MGTGPWPRSIQSQMGDRNPWDFRFVRSLARPDEFRDEGALRSLIPAVATLRGGV